MKISGVARMHAPPGLVWAALNDPNVLVAAIPGCERLEPAGPDSYRFTVAAAVASIHGIYTGEVSLSQQQEPSSFLLTATGSGGPGTVSTSVQVRLADAAGGTTELHYDADAVIGGMIAGVGQRMLSSIARRMAAEFFSSVDLGLAGDGVAVSQAAGPAPSVPAPTGLAPTVPASTGRAPTVPAPPVPAPTGRVPAPAEPSGYLAPATPSAAASTTAGFVRGVLVGVAVTLAGVGARGLIGRRAR